MDDQSSKFDLDLEAEEFGTEELEATDPNAFYTSLRSALERLRAYEAEMDDDSYIDVA